VWALVENRSPVFQAAVDGALSVHGRDSVHAIADSRTMRVNFHHLTGRYHMAAYVHWYR